MFVYGVPPCNTCTSAIIKMKLYELILRREDIDKCHEPWKSSWAISLMMLNEAGIKLTLI